jgi:hypothetical protein
LEFGAGDVPAMPVGIGFGRHVEIAVGCFEGCLRVVKIPGAGRAAEVLRPGRGAQRLGRIGSALGRGRCDGDRGTVSVGDFTSSVAPSVSIRPTCVPMMSTVGSALWPGKLQLERMSMDMIIIPKMLNFFIEVLLDV